VESEGKSHCNRRAITLVFILDGHEAAASAYITTAKFDSQVVEIVRSTPDTCRHHRPFPIANAAAFEQWPHVVLPMKNDDDKLVEINLVTNSFMPLFIPRVSGFLWRRARPLRRGGIYREQKRTAAKPLCDFLNLIERRCRSRKQQGCSRCCAAEKIQRTAF